MAHEPHPFELRYSFAVITRAHRRYVDALRRGGFVCFLPGLIDPAWDEWARERAGFPMALSFTGLPPDLERQPVPFVLTSTYWCVPASYFSREGVRGMLYRTRPAGPSHVEPFFSEPDGYWLARKWRGGEWVAQEGAPEINQLVLRFTMPGRQPDEPARAFATCEDSGSLGVQVWAPGPADAAAGDGARESP